MSILIGFAPFIVFAVLNHALGVVPALLAAAATSAAILIRDRMRGAHSIKLLEIGSLALFGSLAVYALVTGARWSLLQVRLIVDAGLVIVVLLTMLLRQPFTLAYAKERAEPSLWNNPRFVKLNYVLTGVWAATLLVILVADIVMVYAPQIPLWVGIAITVAALLGAFKFTAWYPEYVQQEASSRSAPRA